MLNNLGSVASIIGMLASFLIYFKIRENRNFYVGKRYLEISKKRMSVVLDISEDKIRPTSSVKREIESIIVFYKKNYLPLFRKKRERNIVKELERLVKNNGDTLPAIKQNLKLLLADLESEEI